MTSFPTAAHLFACLFVLKLTANKIKKKKTIYYSESGIINNRVKTNCVSDIAVNYKLNISVSPEITFLEGLYSSYKQMCHGTFTVRECEIKLFC